MSKKKRKNSRNTASVSTSSESKKAAVLQSRKSKAPLIITLLAAAALAGGGIYLLGGGESGPVAAKAVVSTSNTTEFTYPVGDFSDGKARYFSYGTPQGINVRYFIMKSSDGVIRAAFDSCDTCWSAGKGYRQEGDYMVCNNCGLRFASVKINEIKGGCNPAPLTRNVRGDQVVIKVNDIVKEGTFYFNYGTRS
jgi:uncharacterized membrane protein